MEKQAIIGANFLRTKLYKMKTAFPGWTPCKITKFINQWISKSVQGYGKNRF